jgi:hypothetical protein
LLLDSDALKFKSTALAHDGEVADPCQT